MGWCGWPPTGTWSVAGRRPTAGGASADRHATRQRARELVESLTGRELEPGAVAAQQLPGPADRLAHAYGENALANEACSSWATTTPCGIRSAPGAQRRRLDPARQLHYRGPGDVHLRRRLQRAVQPPGRSTWGALLSVPTGSGCSASAPSSPTPWAATHPGPPIGSSPTAAPAPPCTTCSRVRLGDGGGPRLRCRWPPRCVEGRHGLFGRWGVEYGDEQRHPSTVPSCRAVGVTSRWMTRRQCRRPLNVTGRLHVQGHRSGRSCRFYALGNYGQYIYADPRADVVVVRLGSDWGLGNERGWRPSAPSPTNSRPRAWLRHRATVRRGARLCR